MKFNFNFVCFVVRSKLNRILFSIRVRTASYSKEKFKLNCGKLPSRFLAQKIAFINARYIWNESHNYCSYPVTTVSHVHDKIANIFWVNYIQEVPKQSKGYGQPLGGRSKRTNGYVWKNLWKRNLFTCSVFEGWRLLLYKGSSSLLVESKQSFWTAKVASFVLEAHTHTS